MPGGPVDYRGRVAPAGPPADPPDRPEDPRGRDADDWDWGGDWDDRPGARASDGGRSPDGGRHPDDGPRASRRASPGGGPGTVGDVSPDDAAPHPAVDAPGRRPDPDRRPRPAPRGSTVARRRATAVGAAVLVLVVLLAVVSARSGDEGDGDRTAATSKVEGDRLRGLTAVAARSSLDLLEREAAVEKYARIGRPIYCGAGRRPWVALTFDDGPGPLSAKWIALMAKEDVPMTLFRIGRNVPGNEEYVRVQRNLGWDSGSHSQNHPALASLGAADQQREIEAGDAASRRVLGRPVRLFRPPYESHDATTDRIVERSGMVQVLWNVDTQDSLGTTSAEQIVASATKGMSPGSIILMHEVKPNTLQAMPRILAALREKGLTPVTVSRMLAGDGPSEAQLRKGYDGCRVDVTPGKASS